MQKEIAEVRNLTMELEEMRSKLALFKKDDLLARKEQIKKLAREHRDDGTLTDNTLNENLQEVEDINSKIAEAEKLEQDIKLAEAKLETAQERAKNNELKEERNFSMENENKKIDIRTAFAKYVLFESTHGQRKDAALTDAEYRALGVATTTTSETFTAPSAGADGINNGGLFIPQEVMLDILREESVESPIYNDIITTAIKGKTKFPYMVSKSGAKTKAELEDTENESVEWKILSGTTGNYTDSIVLTFEEEAMAIAEFTDYLISLISDSMRELLINDYIYGTGTDDHVTGITVDAIDGSYANGSTDYLAALEKAIAKLPVKKRAGAKIYLSSNIFDAITFVKDKNGNYMLPVLNGGGFTRLSTFPVAMDVNLKAGEFIIGNVTKWYKANVNKPMELGLDVSNQKRTKTYTTHMMVTAIPVPNSFVYGKETAGV